MLIALLFFLLLVHFSTGLIPKFLLLLFRGWLFSLASNIDYFLSQPPSTELFTINPSSNKVWRTFPPNQCHGPFRRYRRRCLRSRFWGNEVQTSLQIRHLRSKWMSGRNVVWLLHSPILWILLYGRFFSRFSLDELEHGHDRCWQESRTHIRFRGSHYGGRLWRVLSRHEGKTFAPCRIKKLLGTERQVVKN